MSNAKFHVQVRDASGTTWEEEWSKEKIAYCLLASNLPAPKYENGLKSEWVPLLQNEYRWAKDVLSKFEFDEIADQWPNGNSAEFNPGSCEKIVVEYNQNRSMVFVDFVVASSVALSRSLIGLASKGMTFLEFDYLSGRYVFQSSVAMGELKRALESDQAGKTELRQFDPELFHLISGAGNGPRLTLTFLCIAGEFKVPFQFWFEA